MRGVVVMCACLRFAGSSHTSAPLIRSSPLCARLMPSARHSLPGPSVRPSSGGTGSSGADEHRGRRILRLGDDVEAVVHAVDQIDVGVAGRTVQGRGALGAAEARVAGLVLFVHVGLDLDDAAGALVVHEVEAEGIGCHLRQGREKKARVRRGTRSASAEEQARLVDAIQHRLHAPVGGERIEQGARIHLSKLFLRSTGLDIVVCDL